MAQPALRAVPDRRKNIVVFADGTGNSASQIFRTNVWRTYEALDLTRSPAPAGNVAPQIAYYHDGVGTSSFKPLALIGGIFGWGLKRNVIDLYMFLCRNYEPGDRIYAFGFSRGAFTIRVLVGMLVREGLVQCRTEEELARGARDAYRSCRKEFDQTGGLVTVLRTVRDKLIGGWRRLRRQKRYEELRKEPLPRIEFVGVWDTVAAYGMPIAEVARGIDDWVWPLSMPNYELSEKVATARHALALDDERDTYHPLLWDEQHEADLVRQQRVAPGRLQQVWFAGMHADVGGGYSNDSLSYVSLDWMMTEAAAAGLRFSSDYAARVKQLRDDCGPMHDSRRGAASYYRYQPRRIAAHCGCPPPGTRVMCDPDQKRELLTSVKLHDSVVERIRTSPDGYAPIVVPPTYTIVGACGAAVTAPQTPDAFAIRQERVWNEVWRKRVNYFTLVGVSLALLALPFVRASSPPAACNGGLCLVGALVTVFGTFLPALASPWVEAFARSPGTFLVFVAAITWLTMRGTALQGRIRDAMRDLWNDSHGAVADDPRKHWIYKLRTHDAYQGTLQFLKWRAAPTFFGLVILFGGPLLAAGIGMVAYQRLALVRAEHSNTVGSVLGAAAGRGAPDAFRTSDVSWDARFQVAAGEAYRVTFVVTAPWADGAIPATPAGLAAGHVPTGMMLRVPRRRALSEAWFRPLAKVVTADGDSQTHALVMERIDAVEPTYVATFTPAVSGSVHLFVNDAIVSPRGLSGRSYVDNHGEARVTIEPLPVATAMR